MRIENNYDLTQLNTFGISARADYFAEIHTEDDLRKLFSSPEYKNKKKLFLGGGSNVLFTKDFDGLVLLNKMKGIEIVDEGEDFVVIKSMGGEMWHDLVLFSVSRGYWGMENLSLIPGTVGAAPMQNIGAYGAELRDTLSFVEVISIETGEKKIFSRDECMLGYRDSVFKNTLKDKYFISAVNFRLSKIPKPNLSYKVLKEYLDRNGILPDNSEKISEAVSAIRRSKLPNPKEIGNAGSFFKNVFVSKEKLEELRKGNPEVPSFEEDGLIKIPSGWLIEQCGWKGRKEGNVGVHDKQALVLVNYGGATGQELQNLAEDIIKSVYSRFGLKLVPEVNFI